MAQDDGSSSPNSRTPTRRSVLGGVGAGCTALLAGCGGVLGSDDGSGTVPSGETPDTEFGVTQSAGIEEANSNVISIEIRHEGGHSLRTENLELYYEDTPIPDHNLWGWTTVLDDPTGWESVGDRWTEGEYISATSTPAGDSTAEVPLGGLFELVWTSPDTDEETTLLSYEPTDCLGDQTPTEDGCPATTTTEN